MKDLKETVNLMLSDDYKDRMVAEYWQTKIRYQKLHKMIIKYEAKTLEFEPTCPIDILLSQKRAMGEYLHRLEVRAEKEGINLESYKE